MRSHEPTDDSYRHPRIDAVALSHRGLLLEALGIDTQSQIDDAELLNRVLRLIQLGQLWEDRFLQ